MPLLKIQTNVEIPNNQRHTLLTQTSSATASILGKPEAYVMVTLELNPDMLFAGSAAPLAYLELKSIGLPEAETKTLSHALYQLVSNQLGVQADRIYIEFSNAERHMWGWNGGTFER